MNKIRNPRAAWTGDQYKGPRQYLDDSQREEAIHAEFRKLAMNCKDPLNEKEQDDAATNWLNSEHCAAVRVDLEHLLQPGSRSSDQSIADAQRMVNQYCRK